MTTAEKQHVAFEIADAIVNEDGYALDPDESDSRAEARDRLVPIITGVLSREVTA